MLSGFHSTVSHPLLHPCSNPAHPVFAPVTVRPSPSVICPSVHLEISVLIWWIHFTECFPCASEDSSVSQVTGGTCFILPSVSPHALSLALSLCHYWTVLSQMKLSLPFLALNQAWGLWHSFGLFLVVSLPWLYWLNITLCQLRM